MTPAKCGPAYFPRERLHRPYRARSYSALSPSLNPFEGGMDRRTGATTRVYGGRYFRCRLCYRLRYASQSVKR